MNVLLVLKSWTVYQYFAFRLLVSLLTGKRRNSTEYICVLPSLTTTSRWNGQAVQVVYISLLQCEGLAGIPRACLYFVESPHMAGQREFQFMGDALDSHVITDSNSIADMHPLFVVPTQMHGMLTCLILLS